MIKWGVIGCGGIADRRTIPGMMRANNAELVAVMDVQPSVAEAVQKKYGAKFAFHSAKDLLALDDIQAVYIASPVFCHKEQTMAAAKAKKHILLEKPMGLTVEEAKEIAAVCRKEQVMLGVGLMMRFAASHQAMKRLIEEGVLGKVVSMRAQFSCWYPDMAGVWRQDSAKSGGGALMDMGIHCIDLLQYITHLTAVDVVGFAGTQTFSYKVDDSAAIVMKMDNGAYAVVEANFNIPDNASSGRLEIYGTKGSLLAEGTLGQTEDGEVQLRLADDTLAYDAAQKREAAAFEKLTFDKGGNMYTKEIEAFGRAVASHTAHSPTGEEAIAVQKIVEQVYRANRR